MDYKVLIIINNLGIGGAERLVIDQANGLIKRGVGVTILTLKSEKNESFFFDLSREINFKNIQFNSFFSLRDWIYLYKYIKKINPDLLMTHLWLSNTVGRIIGRLCGVKKIFSFEHNAWDDSKTKKLFLINFILQFFCDKIIAVSNAVKTFLIEHRIRKSKIEVVFNGIDLSRYKNFDNNIKNNKDFIFVFIGRLIEQKGIDILLKAFSSLDFGKLLLVGEGPLDKEMKQIVKKMGIENRVVFLGFRKDIPNILASADCFVLPSQSEGFGIVLTEAMASRLPIIVSNFDAVKDIIIDGVTGFVVKKGDYLELANKMRYVYNHKEVRQSVAARALGAVSNFSIEKHIEKIINLAWK